MVLGGSLLNEARVAYLDGDPVTLWEAQELSTTYTRGGSVPFTIGESRSADLYGRQLQIADTLSWSRGRHNLRFGGSVIRHRTGGFGSEPGQAILGTFTFLNTTTKPFEELTLADVQQYSQPVSYGITSYILKQWMSVAPTFPAGKDRVVTTGETTQITIPRKDDTVSGANFEILVGFEVTPQMAEFNRQGSRFTVTSAGTAAAGTTAAQ